MKSIAFSAGVLLITVIVGMGTVEAQLPGPQSNPNAAQDDNRDVDQDAVTGSAGNAGGAAFANFDSLMQLIQTTIAPDTWDTLGGQSSILPYPQGIFVDARGMVQTVDSTARTSVDPAAWASELEAAMERGNLGDAADWRRPAMQRCVSLAALLRHVQRCVDQGQPIPADALHFAGLSDIQFVWLDGDDVRLVGKVGGIRDAGGVSIDTSSGAAALRMDAWLAVCRNMDHPHPIGCTIDPTPAGLAAAADVGRRVSQGQLPWGTATDAMAAALGRQRVAVFGIAGDTPLAHALVTVDRHMKQLALGQYPMPVGVDNYLQQIDRHISQPNDQGPPGNDQGPPGNDQGPPDDLLLRLWLTAGQIKLHCNADRSVLECRGRPIRLASEHQVAVADGTRGAVKRSAVGDDFVAGFNQNWSAIRSMYPLYGAVESLFEAAAMAEIVRQFGDASQHDLLRSWSAVEIPLWSGLHVPTQVDSIAVAHTLRTDSKRHRILVASGGVSLQAREMLPTTATVDASLESFVDGVRGRSIPATAMRPEPWWWDIH